MTKTYTKFWKENEDVIERPNDPINFDNVERGESEESDSDNSNFIVSDDEGDPNKQHQRKKKRRPKDALVLKTLN